MALHGAVERGFLGPATRVAPRTRAAPRRGQVRLHAPRSASDTPSRRAATTRDCRAGLATSPTTRELQTMRARLSCFRPVNLVERRLAPRSSPGRSRPSTGDEGDVEIEAAPQWRAPSGRIGRVEGFVGRRSRGARPARFVFADTGVASTDASGGDRVAGGGSRDSARGGRLDLTPHAPVAVLPGLYSTSGAGSSSPRLVVEPVGRSHHRRRWPARRPRRGSVVRTRPDPS